MSFTSNRSGYTNWQHSQEAQELTQFIEESCLFHCLISSDDLLARALITDWSRENHLNSPVACIDASSYLLLREKRLTPLQRQKTHKLPAVVVIFDSHRLATHHIAEIIREHTEEHRIRLLLCGNEGLRNAAIELGHSSERMTLLTRHDIKLTYRILQQLLGEHREKYPDLPSEPSPSLLADIHEFAEGQVSRMETGFTRWLQTQKHPLLSRFSLSKASNEHSFWHSRRLATQGVSLALIAGLSLGGWKHMQHVDSLIEPDVHQVSVKQGTQHNPYTVTLATSYSKKQLVRYQQQHHLPTKNVSIRHVAGKKYRYELDLGNYANRKDASVASRTYRYSSSQGHHSL